MHRPARGSSIFWKCPSKNVVRSIMKINRNNKLKDILVSDSKATTQIQNVSEHDNKEFQILYFPPYARMVKPGNAYVTGGENSVNYAE
jgi:hypothetical protein